MDNKNLKKLEALKNPKVMEYVNEAIALCKPDKVTVITDSPEDAAYVRELAIKNGEEAKLNTQGHTIHFDGPKDQGRDKEHTRYLVSKDINWGIDVNYTLKKEGVPEIRAIVDGSMKGKEMLISFFALGPLNSQFSLKALQVTDSAYVTHAEAILYRSGYNEFKKLNGSADFLYFLHSAGRLENGVSMDVDKRRIYIDLEENRVYTINNQYAGNSVGLKKLAFRLAIQKANNEGWLAEHMFLMGVHGKRGRITYFTGAFPSACGKTSTAMIPGQTIIGDDIAYLRKVDGKVRAVNVEQGIFGIIQDVNPRDDALIYKALTTPREVIFSNVLINSGKPYWLGMGMEPPEEGINFAGKWFKGKTDANGKPVPYAHKNARYTIRISELDNADKKADDPKGVMVQAIVYGGRDSDTSVPIAESLTWAHGVFMGSTVESETTAATIGKEGVREHSPMANLDFLSVPLKKYIKNHLAFGKNLEVRPKIYTTNYFLKSDGKYLNDIPDKKVWILWAEGRVHKEYKALKTPIGMIPMYEDLKKMFKKERNKDYSREDYIAQFSLRVGKYLEKMERMVAVFNGIDMPAAFSKELQEQISRLKETKKKYGDIVSPFEFEKK
ncbi:MAG: phosphoenolpyruvate carboxykinase (GTP) [Eubacteriales bacterium]|nr:phosphoenolpyruvate carboxykinase (GTP) [Eubacteriales bacterium]